MQVDIAAQDYPAGEHIVEMPPGDHRYRGVRLSMPKAGWPKVDGIVRFRLERETENGWVVEAEQGFTGEDRFDRQGQLITAAQSELLFWRPREDAPQALDPEYRDGRYRAVLTFAQPLHTSISLEGIE